MRLQFSRYIKITLSQRRKICLLDSKIGTDWRSKVSKVLIKSDLNLTFHGWNIQYFNSSIMGFIKSLTLSNLLFFFDLQ